jgi:hypothetical protein
MNEDEREHFRNLIEALAKCYGKDAKCVNVENMMQVAKTMNELFLSK